MGVDPECTSASRCRQVRAAVALEEGTWLHPVVSVVTAVREADIGFLSEGMNSLVQQRLPSGWSWEWQIQIDGNGELPTEITADGRVKVGRNTHGGPAVARNLALARSVGSLVRTLDADDLLLPEALAQDIDILGRLPEIGWTVAPAIDLEPDGTLCSCSHDNPAPGRVPRGGLLQAWRDSGWATLPVVPSTLCIRRSLVVVLGGWMALPTSEDTGLLLAANATSEGWVHARPGNIYRKHHRQLTSTPDHRDPLKARVRHRLIAERATLMMSPFYVAD